MRSKKQEEEMKIKILLLSKLFLESNYSDIEFLFLALNLIKNFF